jgi:hypothetical protein
VTRWASLSDFNPILALLHLGFWVLGDDHGPIDGWSGRRRMAALLVSLITTATLGRPVMAKGVSGNSRHEGRGIARPPRIATRKAVITT